MNKLKRLSKLNLRFTIYDLRLHLSNRKSKILNRKSKGFTLIELMVVIVILGILAAIIAPNIIGRTYDAELAKVKMDIESVSTALKLYRLDNGSYPGTEEGLQSLIEAPPGARNWRKGGYLEGGKIPKDPWGNEYIYLCPGSHGPFDVISYGADGQPEGDGENKDINSWEIN